MAEDFGLKIALQGEREFKRAISDINASFKVLGSEMNLVDAQFKRSDDAQAKYAAKGRVLVEQISAQKDRITTLEAALKNAATNFGETDRRTLAWQTQLNNAKAVLANFEGELEDNTKALCAFGDNAGEAGDGALEAAKDTARLEKAVDDLGDEMDASAKTALSFADVLKANLASEAIVAGVKAIGAAIKAVGRGFVDAMKDGVAYNATMESYTASFTTMLGDEAKAHQLVADLKAKAASTPYGMQDLADATRTLMSFGISANDAQKYMGMLGDVAQGDKEKFSSLSLAFAQVSSAGKLTGQDLMQMINAGFNPLEEISRKTGKSIGELKEEMGKGAISAQMVAEAFESATAEGGRFYGAMQNQSQTFSGQLSTLQDGVASLKGQLAGGLTDMLSSSVLPMVNGWVTALSEAFEKDGVTGLVDALGQVLQEALTFISGQLPVVVNSGLEIVKALLEGIISVLPEVGQCATDLLVALIGAIIEALPSLVQAASEVVASLVSGIGQALPELIPAAVEAVMTIVQGLVDNLPMLLDAALALITGLAQGLIAAIPVIIEALPGIISALVDFFVGSLPQIAQAGISLFEALIGELPAIIQTISAALPKIITSIVQGLLRQLPVLIQTGVKLLTALIGQLPQIIQVLVTAMPTIISGVVSALVAQIPRIIQTGIELFVSLLTALPQIISELVSKIPQIVLSLAKAVIDNRWRFLEAGKDLVRGLWEGIKSLASWLWDKVSQWCSNIWNSITDFFGINSPSREMAWIGDMLTRGLAQGIEKTGQRAVDAASGLASDTFDHLSVLSEGIDVPVNTSVASSVAVDGFSSTQPVSQMQDLVHSSVRDVLEGLNLQVVLSDGTLVGHLAPAINERLGVISARQGLMFGGY